MKASHGSPAVTAPFRLALARATGRSQRLYPYLMVAPVVVLVSLIVFYPLAYVAYLSFQEYSPFYAKAMRFVGAANYVQLLNDPEFWHSLAAAGIWVVGSVVPQFLLGLGMALLLNERFAGRGTVRTIILLPWVVSGVVTGIIWLWLFDGTVGVINDLLIRAHVIQFPVAWMVQPLGTWMVVFLANAWRGAPFFAIVLLAALQSISPSLYEAAKIDGAGRWQSFRAVTLPLIVDAIIIATLLRALWTFNFIDLIWTMTRGGPVDTTLTLPVYIFNTAYQNGNFGYAATLAVALSIILLTFSGLYWQLNRFAADGE